MSGSSGKQGSSFPVKRQAVRRGHAQASPFYWAGIAMSDEALPCLARSLSKTFRLRHVSAQGAGASGASTTALRSSRGICADKHGGGLAGYACRWAGPAGVTWASGLRGGLLPTLLPGRTCSPHVGCPALQILSSHKREEPPGRPRRRAHARHGPAGFRTRRSTAMTGFVRGRRGSTPATDRATAPGRKPSLARARARARGLPSPGMLGRIPCDGDKLRRHRALGNAGEHVAHGEGRLRADGARGLSRAVAVQQGDAVGCRQ